MTAGVRRRAILQTLVTAGALARPLRAQRAPDSAIGMQSLSPIGAPPVTVADLIGMTTVGNFVQGHGDGNVDYNVVSPDGSRIAVVVQRGNLERNTVEFALLMFRKADLLRAPKADTVATFASSSNRPGIVLVRWLADNVTLAFLAEQPGELPQVYTLDTRTRLLTRRTHAATEITAFDVASAGDPVVYAAEEPPPDTSAYTAMRAHGFVLAPNALVSDIIAGKWGVEASKPRVLHVVRGAKEMTVTLPDSAAGYQSCELWGGLWVAPTGDAALVKCAPRVMPAAWKGYRQPQFRDALNAGYVYPMYVVIDLATGRVRPLLAAPADFATTLVWAPDGRSVVLADAILPLNERDSAERAARTTHAMLAEVDVHTGAVTVIARRDSRGTLAWDPQTATLELATGERYMAFDQTLGMYYPRATAHVYYQRTRKGWAQVRADSRVAARGPELVVEQGRNAPVQLVAVDPRLGRLRVVYDPNPGLLSRYRFGRETVVHWKTRAGAAGEGGLYWPPDYAPGRRYPLVIQTHGFDSLTFRPQGVLSTGEAAQPLANHGVMVLQMTDKVPADQLLTPREGPLAVEQTEGAIDYLDSLGLIDRTKIGMQGFSRTCYYTLYFLTHSRYPIAAATVTDGVDMSYMQYVVFMMGAPVGVRGGFEKMNGGPPLGASLKTWMALAPGFTLDHIAAPLQLTAITPSSLLSEWEPYAGLLLQGKPAEMVLIPDGAHILVKPWERMTSQQSAVDWYLFWLKSEEDPDPAKAEQYTRWRVLRERQQHLRSPTSGAATQ